MICSVGEQPSIFLPVWDERFCITFASQFTFVHTKQYLYNKSNKDMFPAWCDVSPYEGSFFILFLEVQEERRLKSSVTWQRVRNKFLFWVWDVASHSVHLPPQRFISSDTLTQHWLILLFIICPNFCFSGFFFPFVNEGASVCSSVMMRAVKMLRGMTVYVMWQ